MTNADMFRAVFNGLMATELWSKPESEFLEWLNAETIPNETFRQEPQPPKVINQYVNWASVLIGNCPKCHAVLQEFDNAKACGVCGQAVKWDEQPRTSN